MRRIEEKEMHQAYIEPCQIKMKTVVKHVLSLSNQL